MEYLVGIIDGNFVGIYDGDWVCGDFVGLFEGILDGYDIVLLIISIVGANIVGEIVGSL